MYCSYFYYILFFSFFVQNDRVNTVAPARRPPGSESRRQLSAGRPLRGARRRPPFERQPRSRPYAAGGKYMTAARTSSNAAACTE